MKDLSNLSNGRLVLYNAPQEFALKRGVFIQNEKNLEEKL